MTQDEIIEMAVQAGVAKAVAEVNIDIMEAFAKLVAAKEREACAKLYEALWDTQDNGMATEEEAYGEKCAAIIRARGEQA